MMSLGSHRSAAAAGRPEARGRAGLRGLVVLLALTGACAAERRPDAILLVSIDTLRPDHLGIYGYGRDTSPSIDRFFANGAIFERAYATGSRTPPSIASMLTGRYPAGHRVRLFYQKLPPPIASIPDLLPGAFQKAGFVGNAVVADEAMGLAHRFDHFEDEVDRPALYTKNVERSAEALTDAALRWLREARDPARPFFLWVHYMDPHSPYLPPEGWPRRGYDHPVPRLVDADRLARNNIQREEAEEGARVDALISVDAYDEEIAYVDHHIGRLLEGFEQVADAEASLVLLTADHGESMLEHQIYFVHGYQVYDEMVRIPMLLRARGVAPGRRDRLVSLVDVLPTVLGHALVEPPSDLPGRDLRPREAASSRRVFAETTYLDNQWRAVWQGDDKWVLEVGVRAGRPERGYEYDLAADPGELAPSTWPPEAPPSDAARELLERALRDPDPAGIPADKRASPDFGAPTAAGQIVREQLEKLRALGYVD